MSQHVDHALDQVRRLGHPQRAAIRDAARRLVGVNAIDRDVSGRDVVGAGDHGEEARGIFGRIGAGIERAVVGEHVHPKARDPAVPPRRELAGHVVVARESRRRQVLDPVLDPLHRHAEHDRGDDRADVARIDADLVAEAAADVGGDDVDLGLGNARQQRGHGAHDVRRLEGAPDGQLAVDLVHRGDAGAGLERAGVHPLIDDFFLHVDLGLGERPLGRLLVADLPGEDVVVMPARTVRARGLARKVVAQDRRAIGERGRGIVERRQLLVLDLDQLDRIGRDVAVVGDHEGDLLVLEQHLAVGQHHLHVAGERRHVVQVQGLQVLGGQHRMHAGQRLGLRDVDRLDPCMAVLAAGEVAEQHARQLQVVDVVALALDEADVLLALARAADAAQRRLALFLGHGGGLGHHSAASGAWLEVDFRWSAAWRTALTMF